MRIFDLDTPALGVDIGVLDANIAALQSACDNLGIALRVHTKTHKTPAIAVRQVDAGAIGIVAQKLGEAEAMAAAGIADILVPYNIVGATKLQRLTRLVLSAQTQLTVTADSVAVVEGVSAAAMAAGCRVRMLVEMDTGGHRCGTGSPEATIELAQRIDHSPGTEFIGVMTYPSSEKARPFLEKVCDLATSSGLALQVISGGGTGSEEISKSLGCTETRIGSYAWEGSSRISKREDLAPSRCPLRMVTTVVSTNIDGQIIIDAGQKAFTSYPPTPYGYCLEHPRIFIKGMSVEHGHVDITASDHTFCVGEILTWIPLHGGMTTNLHDRLFVVDGDNVIDEWAVAGRGRSQ